MTDPNELADLKIVEEAGLQPNVEMVAATMIVSLHMLKKLSRETGLPIEKIDAALIIEKLKAAVRSA